MTARPLLILASASPRRLDLLSQIGVVPDRILPATIDESLLPRELPAQHARRLAVEKNETVLTALEKCEACFVLAADTVVAVGRRILPKTEDEGTARACLALLSGRSHRVYTAVALYANARVTERVVETRVKVARLEAADIDAYIASGEWRGKAGGYAIQGVFAKHVASITGSWSNVVGLPLYETANLLKGAGWR